MSLNSVRLWTAVGLTLCTCWLPNEPLGAQSNSGPQVTTDLYGDPLPLGALARMGTLRLRHFPGVAVLTFSPDGKILASVDRHATTCRLWDATTGKQLQRFGNWKDVAGPIAFSPDGMVLALGCGKEIRLVQLPGGKELRRLGSGLGQLQELAFSPDGKTLAVADERRGATLWDVVTGKSLRELKEEEPQKFVLLAGMVFSPNGKTLAAAKISRSKTGKGDLDCAIGLWEVSTGRLLRQFEKHSLGLTELRFWRPTLAMTSDGLLAAVTRQGSGQGGKTIHHLWEAATGKERLRCEINPSFGSIVFSSDGKIRAAGGEGGKIHLFSAQGKEARWVQGHKEEISCLAVAPNGKTLASCSQGDSAIRLWDSATGKELCPQACHQGWILSLTLTPDDKQLVTGSSDNTVRLWDAVTGKQLHRLDGAGRQVTSLACAPDGTVLAVGGGPGTIQLLDLKTRTEHRAVAAAKEQPIESLAFSPDVKLLAWGDAEGNLCLWDPLTRKPLRRLGKAEEGIQALAFAPGGKQLFSSSHDRLIGVWDVAGKKAKLASFRREKCLAEAWSPDGKTLAYGGLDGALRLLEMATGKIRGQFPERAAWVCALAFSPDGRRLACGRSDGSIALWALDGGKLLRVLQGHRESVCSLCFFRDGNRLASAGGDTTALVWDVGQEKKDEPEPKRTPKELQKLWEALADDSASKAAQALWALALSPKQSVPFLQKQLKPLPPLDPKNLARLLKDLGHDHFPTRDKATRELEQLGEPARQALEKALQGKPLLEVRKRAEWLLDKLNNHELTLAELRVIRTVEALEHIGNAEAIKLLEQLAGGTPGALLTEEARGTLQRLTRKTPPP
jgi:WD40 repeat protein